MEVYSSKIPLRHYKHVAFDLVLWKCLTCILRPWENVGPLKRTNFLFSNVFYPSLLPVSLVFFSSHALSPSTKIQYKGSKNGATYIHEKQVKKGKKFFNEKMTLANAPPHKKYYHFYFCHLYSKTCFITEKNRCRKVSSISETHTNSSQSIFLITFKAMKNG